MTVRNFGIELNNLNNHLKSEQTQQQLSSWLIIPNPKHFLLNDPRPSRYVNQPTPIYHPSLYLGTVKQTRASLGLWTYTSLKLQIWAEILVSSDMETPWLDGHHTPRFKYQGGGDTFLP